MISDAGNHKEAIARGTEWLSDHPSETLQAIVGVILVRDLQWKRAKELLELSLADGIPREHVHRSLGHIAHELDLSKKKPKALHVKQREFRECVADLKRKLPGVSQTRRPSEVEFDSLMNAARNLGV